MNTPIRRPRYGRLIQQCVERAMTIEDREKRNLAAQTIISRMRNISPVSLDDSDLWNHLAIIADYRLDIDYPYELTPKEELLARPAPLPYPNYALSGDVYGRNVPIALNILADLPDSPMKAASVYAVACLMKRCHLSFNASQSDDTLIFSDIKYITKGALIITPLDMTLPANSAQNNGNSNANKSKNKNKQKQAQKQKQQIR